MASIIVQSADALTAALTVTPGTFSQEFTPLRSWADFELELAAACPLRVDVVPAVNEIVVDYETHEALRYTLPIDVGIRQRFGPETQEDSDTGRITIEAIDELVELTEELLNFLTPTQNDPAKDGRLADFPDAVWQGTTIRTVAPRNHLREWRQFTGIIRVTYWVYKILT